MKLKIDAILPSAMLHKATVRNLLIYYEHTVAWRLKAGLSESRRAPSAKQRLQNS
jgi:hypothetical protein